MAGKIRPVPLVARTQLVSLGFGRELLTYAQPDRTGAVTRISLQRLREPGYAFADVRRGGSDGANAATFRWIALGNGTIALEAFALPKRFVGTIRGAYGDGLRLLDARQYGSTPPAFRPHALADSKGAVLLESVSSPGHYIARTKGPSMIPLVLGTRDVAVAFTREPSAAQYPHASFWADGIRGRGVLLWPLHDMIDETYTVYFRACAAAGCTRERPVRDVSRWLDAKGYLPEKQGSDLYSKQTTIAQAKAFCATDAACTSFCADCTTRACADEPAPLSVHFKSFTAPGDAIGQAEGSGWHTFFLPQDEGRSTCVVEPPSRPRRVCTRRPKANAKWQMKEGFLIAAPRHDLYQRRATLEHAQVLCTADADCTSFTFKCATADCAAERTTTTIEVFFKSYPEPAAHLGHDAAKGGQDGYWRSLLVQSGDTEEVCQSQDAD